MLVTLITAYGKTKTRVEIDYDKTLVLSNKDVALYGLREGEDISGETWAVMEAAFRKDVIRKCGLLLKDCSYSCAGLKRKLVQNGFPEEIADYAVAKMEEAHYVDDRAMAEGYIRTHFADKSRARIRYDLMNKGISSSLLDEVFDHLEREYGDNICEAEIEQIRKLMTKRKYDPAEADRTQMAAMWKYLSGKGYSKEAIERALT